ncbi:MAG: hypothetical protein JEZ02_13425 [Desulfatibacillum sp.]|nr:hypothetical protein [Desulfatibacillum sp.]
MQSINQPEPTRILAAAAIILVFIEFLAWKLHAFLGVVLLPFVTFGVAFAVIRISAPWYVRRKALSYIRKNQGRVDVEQLVTYLTPISKRGANLEGNRAVIVDFIQNMEQERVISIQPDGTVVKAKWGGRVP